MSGHKVTAYQSTKNQILNNYGKCLTLAVAPLAISYLLGFQSGHTVPIGRGSKKMGLASLVVTLPLTVVTSGLATVGVVANTVYGGIALPVSVIKDKVSPKTETSETESLQSNEDSDEELNSSTKQMLESMPKQQEKVTEIVSASSNSVTSSSAMDVKTNTMDEDGFNTSYAI
ncbi:hypothetical protein [Legionella shakespearei]|uniref:Uncharacterized protein n=1 Tax=Legionella shakespearei DSM 23087 TaxID=1122169 RepID=A0A0W0YVI4_9GAMM|nr:hypothetical protein [Legionella shakespearei]KTD60917.1 hypothetical protein Lsha_1328 [Legionella shakespearei DSM 23087]